VKVSDKLWRVVLYTAAAASLVLGVIEAVREQQFSNALAPSTPPPAFVATRTDGKPFSLDELKGKVVILSFWATWCGPCLREMPMLRKLELDLGARGVTLVAANMDDADSRAEAVAAWERAQGGNAPLIVFPSDNTGHDWHAGVLPTLYVLGRHGQIAAGYSGAQGEAKLREDLEDALRAP
jgi:cytochrome c biogenesis protein CcmG, thiol:disulfide interchange protein DsbE